MKAINLHRDAVLRGPHDLFRPLVWIGGLAFLVGFTTCLAWAASHAAPSRHAMPALSIETPGEAARDPVLTT